MLLTPSLKNETHILSSCCTKYFHYISCLVCKADRDDPGWGVSKKNMKIISVLKDLPEEEELMFYVIKYFQETYNLLEPYCLQKSIVALNLKLTSLFQKRFGKSVENCSIFHFSGFF